jgi:hypothetical protein
MPIESPTLEEAMTDLTGVWTYRSFINNPATVQTPQDALALIFGEGTLTIADASPESGFKAELSFGGDAIMDLIGDVIAASGDAPLTAKVKGRGRAGSSVADFAYDYVFYLAPTWPNGIDQRQALVGTVLRVEDHGAAKKGFTASSVTLRQGA